MKALIISGGKEPSKELILESIKDIDIIIGADKGCEIIYKYDIKADYILGDFDSINKDLLCKIEKMGAEKITFNSEKDFTDTEIAFNLAIEKGCTDIILIGVTGTRYDHSLANIGLLRRALEKNISAIIMDDNNKMFLTDKDTILKGDRGDIISFYAYCDEVKEFNIENAKYNLKNYNLKLGDGITTSNEFLDEDIKISFNNGLVLVIYTKD